MKNNEGAADPRLAAEAALLAELKVHGHDVITIGDAGAIKALSKDYYVYALSCDGALVVAGLGRTNRVRVIGDGATGPATMGHVKSLYVRLLRKYRPNSRFTGYCLGPMSRREAKQVEKLIHAKMGGNKLALPPDVKSALDLDLEKLSGNAALLVRLAVRSNFCGFSDLRRWAQDKLIDIADSEAINKLLGIDICVPEKLKRQTARKRLGAAPGTG